MSRTVLDVRATAPGPVVGVPPSRRRALRAADLTTLLAGLGLGVTAALGVASEGSGSLAAPGGWATAAGRMTGLIGSYLMLVVLVLSARLPWLERALGQDRLITWHRRIGPWPIVLILWHAVLLAFGYGAAAGLGPVAQTWDFVAHYPNLLAATVALGLIALAGLTSWRIARRRMRYETWWVVHLYTYLALALAFAHQLTAGAAFVGHPVARAWWITIWAGAVGCVLTFRFGLPLVRSLRHQLRVVAVRSEGPGVVSVVMHGRGLDRLAIRGGQFFQWRFMTRGLWWQAHPYSLSAMPRGDYLRTTVKALGDHSAALAGIPLGTRVFVEGPYGVLTRDTLATRRVLLVGAGVGVTPLRALLEDLPRGTDVVVLLRGSTADSLVHADEVDQLVAARGGRLHVLLGSRQQVRLDAAELARLVPDIADRDVYLCGPEGLTDQVSASARRLGTPHSRIHVESFTC